MLTTLAGSPCILVFAIMASGYVFLIESVGSEESPLAALASIVVGLGIIPASVFAIVLAFDRIEPDVDWYLNSRFCLLSRMDRGQLFPWTPGQNAFLKASRSSRAVLLP